MASPQLSPYKTNGPVRTGRTANAGDHCSGTLRAFANGTELAAGFARFSGVKTFDFIPVVTWTDYPTGIIDIPCSGGNPTASAPAAIYDSYNDPWRSAWPYPGSPTAPTELKPIELRFYCELYSSATRKIVWLSSGGGSTWVAEAVGGHYEPAADCDFTASFELFLDVALRERVEITQSVGAGGAWVWPDGCFKDGMGKTSAVFDAVADTTNSYAIMDGVSVTMPSGYVPSYDFDFTRTIEGRVGSYSAAIGVFGWGNITNYADAYTRTGASVFGSLTQIASIKVGTRESDLRLGYTAGSALTYTGTASNSRSYSEASDDEIIYKVTHSTSSSVNAYANAIWTDLGIAYKHEVDFATMDDGAAAVTPAFNDIASDTDWTGGTSPLIVYSGVWTLEMRDLAGSQMSTYTQTTDHVAGQGAKWYRSEPSPSYLSLKLTNPEDYNDTAESVYNASTGLYDELDDIRVQFYYPREETASWALDTTTELDALSTIGTAGVGGWTAVNCTLAESDGNLVVSDASSGAYIYRSDFVTDADIRKPKHWSGHRFCKISATALDGDSISQDIALTLTVLRTAGGQDTFTKTYSNPIYSTTQAVIDICRPDESGVIDTAESYIDQAKPLDTVQTGGSEGAWVIESAELSDLSWSWGIGAFDKIQIGGFLAGNTYTLTSLDTIYQTPDPDTFGAVTYIQPERRDKRDVGDTALNDDPADNWRNYVWRHIIAVINGRYAWEAPSVKVSMSPTFEVDNYVNYSLKNVFTDSNNRWPVDDFEAYAFTIPADFDAGDWDAGLSEYTNERVLFAGDVCPIWFCQSKRQDGEHDELHTEDIKLAPLYDQVTVYPSYGDGTGTATRTGYTTLRSVKRVRGRANGVLWTNFTYGVDTVDLVSDYSETVTSDDQGYYRSADHNKPLELDFDGAIATVQPGNRLWSRVCMSLPKGSVFLSACSSKQTGRSYVVYTLGSSTKLRIYDYGNRDYIDREVVDNAPDNACGIAFTQGRSAGLTVVYDFAGSVYRIVSTDEGKTWSDKVSIATGTKPQVCYSQQARLEITSYYSGGNAYCRIKLDEGSYGDAVLIAASDDSPTAIAILPGTRQNKIMADVVQSGAIVRYTSTDNGKSWSVDE